MHISADAMSGVFSYYRVAARFGIFFNGGRNIA